MLQPVSVPDTQNIFFDRDALAIDTYQNQPEAAESIMDKADIAATSTKKRLTHAQVFGALRSKLHAK